MPGTYQVEITPEQLREAASHIDAAAAHIHDEVATVHAQIHLLTDQIFDGRAADQTLSDYNAAYQGFQAMPEQLQQLARLLRKHADDFEILDERLARQGRTSGVATVDHSTPTVTGNAWLNKEFNAQLVWDHTNYMGAFISWGLTHSDQLGPTMHRLLSKFGDVLPVSDNIGDYLYVKGAWLSPKLFYEHESILKGISTVGGGITDGLFDYAFGGEYSTQELATQVGSGVLQAFLPPEVQLVNAGVQVVGNLASNAIEGNADWLAMGDAARTAEIITSANNFQAALDVIDVDSLSDNMVDAVITGDFDELGSDLKSYGAGLGTFATEGASLVGYTVEGFADQISANTYIDETISDVATGFATAANDFVKSLPF